MRVVIIEDDPGIAGWVAEALRFIAGMEVKIITANFSKLIGNGQWDGIDAVLCDWQLQDFDTSKLFEYLAAERPHVRRVVYTAFPLDQIPRDNVDQVLSKPLSIDTIARALMGENQRGEDL